MMQLTPVLTSEVIASSFPLLNSVSDVTRMGRSAKGCGGGALQVRGHPCPDQPGGDINIKVIFFSCFMGSDRRKGKGGSFPPFPSLLSF